MVCERAGAISSRDEETLSDTHGAVRSRIFFERQMIQGMGSDRRGSKA